MSDTLIATALETRLFTVAGLPDAAHRALENADYTPIVGEPWIRVTHHWGNERVRTLPASGGRVARFGFMQVDVFTPVLPVTGGGGALTTLLEAIRAVFPPGLPLAIGGSVLEFHVRESRRWRGQRERHWWTDHVDVHWDCAVTNLTF